MSTFEVVTIAEPSGRPRLEVSGDVDLASAPQLLDAATQVLADLPAGSQLLLDLVGVTFIDSSGLGALVQIRNALAEAGGALVVVAQSHAVELAVGYAGLGDVFEVGKGL